MSAHKQRCEFISRSSNESVFVSAKRVGNFWTTSSAWPRGGEPPGSLFEELHPIYLSPEEVSQGLVDQHIHILFESRLSPGQQFCPPIPTEADGINHGVSV